MQPGFFQETFCGKEGRKKKSRQTHKLLQVTYCLRQWFSKNVPRSLGVPKTLHGLHEVMTISSQDLALQSIIIYPEPPTTRSLPPTKYPQILPFLTVLIFTPVTLEQ